MNRSRVLVILAVVATVVACGAAMGPGCKSGDLSLWNFSRISVNGFDKEDQAVDANDYAWSMEYFVPDGEEAGHLYVGTGNSMLALILFQFETALRGGGTVQDLAEGPITPPEIRRYRPDLDRREWERVLDYRDVETDPDFSTIGFRNLKTYSAQSDGRKYLYAATMGASPALWRTSTGTPGSWEKVWESGEVGSVRWMEPHHGLLYLALAVDIPGVQTTGKIWATDGADFWPVIEDGFGIPNNSEVECLISFNDWLYAGTKNVVTGYEVWKFAGPGPQAGAAVRVVDNGGPSSRNELVGTPCIFNGQLYMGSLIFVGGFNLETMNFFKGCDIIRINPDDTWETVVGDHSPGGVGSGFGNHTNGYLWWMEAHNGWLYAGTLDNSAVLRLLLENFGEVLSVLLAADWDQLLNGKMDTIDQIFEIGADLYKTADGVTWYIVSRNGLGNPHNYGIRTMCSVDKYLYVGTTNPFDGLEVWRGTVY